MNFNQVNGGDPNAINDVDMLRSA
jgi:hypothetical protein